MSLQQELLNDLADLDQESDLDELQNDDQSNRDLINDLDDLSDDESNKETENLSMENSSFQKSLPSSELQFLTKVYSSSEFKQVIERIDQASLKQSDENQVISGPVEDTEEFKLIVEGNDLSIKIDREFNLVLKYVRDHYQYRFPELESLVTNPISYAQTVKKIGYSDDIGQVNLDSILPPATRMVVAVTAATTAGQPLDEKKMKKILDGVDALLGLHEAMKKIISYVEAKIIYIAPNLTEIVGSSIAAKLVIEAEGLSSLSKIPSCNLQVLGKQMQHAGNQLSFGKNSYKVSKHAGYMMEAELVKQVPSDFRSKMVRMVAAKAALAIRVDSQQGSRDGSVGRQIRKDLEQRVEKLLEPSLIRATKPLPVPFEGTKTRRAGKRVRREKMSTAATELAKSANRLMFGVHSEEVVVNDEMINLGQLGQNSGRIRAITANNTGKVGISKKYQKILHLNNNPALQHPTSSASSLANGSHISGLATSLSFTPVQGIELSNPKALIERQNRVAEANAKYFSGGFASALPKK
ncbi:U4/U6 small nuclear ribonucleoprotein Prp31 [Smittium culicis]|uniref:U4/U6 small nuclear ribonucleoprotein Prp31 n=1 Tax=Smittium culicis TaxID=133412 RepID=A0A1R1XDV8_9FUNG|nr:U4/U6 small nuclear ribonucleoprotein Prp31 [Smittium culicis]OMJ12809.1 U4/U6 small nuclear ribonucleoprotein Prp31 [Smittium culicis]